MCFIKVKKRKNVMKRLFVSIVLFGLAGSGNLLAMDPAYAEATAGRSLISSGNAGQVSEEQSSEKKRSIESEESSTKRQKNPMITFQTSDDQKFELPLELAKKIPFIKNMLEDIGAEQETAIELPITKYVFQQIILLLEGKLSDFEDTLGDYNNFSLNDVIALANGCEYLGISVGRGLILERLLDESQINIDSFSEIYSQLNFESRTLLWQQHPAYNYFAQEKSKKILKLSNAQAIISPDRTKLIGWTSWGGGNSIKIWNLNHLDEAPRELKYNGTMAIHKVIVSPDGAQLAIFGVESPITGGVIVVWNLNNLRAVPHKLYMGTLGDIAISSVDNRLIYFDGISVKAWNLGNLDNLLFEKSLKAEGAAFKVRISPDGNKLISKYELEPLDRNRIKIWDMYNLDNPPYEIIGGAFYVINSAESKLISAVADAGKFAIKMWDLKNLYQAPRDILNYAVSSVSKMILDPDGNKLVIVSDAAQEKLIILDINNLHQLQDNFDFPAGIVGCALSPDGNYLAVWTIDSLIVWDFNYPHQIVRQESLTNGSSNNGVIVSLDTNKLIFFGDNKIIIWNFINKLLRDLNLNQINLMIWLYNNSDELTSVESELILSEQQKIIYQTLPDSLKNILQKLFPLLVVEVDPERSLEKAKDEL